MIKPLRSSIVRLLCAAGLVLGMNAALRAAEASSEAQIRAALDRSLPLLELASAGSARQRTCFTCHSQALPVLAFAEAGRRGIPVDRSNFTLQVAHTHSHLRRGLRSYEQGKGQGGGVDTAGYALWTLQEGGQSPDVVTSAVLDWLLQTLQAEGYWKRSSHRPPSEASNFTTTYLALRALQAYGTDAHTDRIAAAQRAAREWLAHSQHADTEDLVFRILALGLVSAEDQLLQTCIQNLQSQQRADGGWAQLESLDSDAYATATALYALQQAGAIDSPSPDSPSRTWNDGIRFLLSSQGDDGTWLVRSRSKPFQPYYETGFPHRQDQFISTTATAWASLVLLQCLPVAAVPSIEALPGTQPLEWTEADLSGRMMQSAHSFVEARIAAANDQRKPVRGDAPGADSRRQQLRSVLGIVDDRLPPRLEFVADDSHPACIFDTQAVEVLQVRWPVFAQVYGEGLLVRPRQSSGASAVIVPDASQSPEDIVFETAGDPHDSETYVGRLTPLLQQLTERGVMVIVPAIVSRHPLPTADARLQKAGYSSREWIYRQAFHMGRHVIGYDIQRVLAAVDWLESRADLPGLIGIAGYGEGGLVALHASAVDERLSVALVSGYFDSSDSVWSEPIDRNVWSRLEQLGNAEVAALLAPRQLIVEHSRFPEVIGQKGELHTPEFARVKAEFDKLPADGWPHILLTGADETPTEPYAKAAVQAFLTALTADSDPIVAGVSGVSVSGGVEPGHSPADPSATVVAKVGPRAVPSANLPSASVPSKSEHSDTKASGQPSAAASAQAEPSGAARSIGASDLQPEQLNLRARIQERQQRTTEQLQAHVQSLVQQSEHTREHYFLHQALPESRDVPWSTQRTHPTLSAADFTAKSQQFRRDFHENAMGRFDAEILPLNARTRLVTRTELWTAWDVVLDVHTDLFSWGILVLPNDIRPGERRPVVVCQHGRNGIPRDTLDADNPAYNNFAARLAEQGFITFAPHNLYRGEDRYRWLDRKANTVGCSLFSLIIPQHDAILRWLKSLPSVDGQRIAFYGLSYGGESAMRIPAVLEDYCLSICSGDFNQWTRKVASTDQSFSFMNTIEWEMPYWNLGQTFDYAEMAWLIFPRPFMVERGHHDRVGLDQWVAYEFARVRWLYAQFGLADRTRIEYFQGGHSIRGEGTFEFLQHWLSAEKPSP